MSSPAPFGGLRRSNGAAEFAGVLAQQVFAPEPSPWRGVLTAQGIDFPGRLPPGRFSQIFSNALLTNYASHLTVPQDYASHPTVPQELRTLRCLRI